MLRRAIVLLFALIHHGYGSFIYSDFLQKSKSSSFHYAGRFCLTPTVIDNPNPSSVEVTIPFAYRKIPLFLAVYWDDKTSQSECEKKLECYESSFVNDKWSNIYTGLPSDAEVHPSCNWRINVAKVRGNLIDLRSYYGKGEGHKLNISTKMIPFYGKRVREYHFALVSCLPTAISGKNKCLDRKSFNIIFFF
jgi:hypothetical protein